MRALIRCFILLLLVADAVEGQRATPSRFPSVAAAPLAALTDGDLARPALDERPAYCAHSTVRTILTGAFTGAVISVLMIIPLSPILALSSVGGNRPNVNAMIAGGAVLGSVLTLGIRHRRCAEGSGGP